MLYAKWLGVGLLFATSMMAAGVERVQQPMLTQNFGGRLQDAKGDAVEGKVQEVACSDWKSESPKVLGESSTDKWGGFQFVYKKGVHCMRIEAKGFRTTLLKLDVTNNTGNRVAFIKLKPE